MKKILWFTWKDLSHPEAGGAELVNEEIAKRLVENGYEVIFLVGGYKGAKQEESIDGYKIIRLGNRFSVYFKAYKYYINNLKGWADLVIDEINTVPFFSKFYVKEKNIILVHQLCREIWFYQMPAPLNFLGYLLEPIYLRILKDRQVITVSSSTKNNLIRYGFKDKSIHIIREGIKLKPLKNLVTIKKFKNPTLLCLGAIRPMKRTHHAIKAFEFAKKYIPDLKLMIAGKAIGSYGKRVLFLAKKSQFRSDITYVGSVNEKKKLKLMQKSHLIAVTSIKEGWGLVVTEANSQGTPAVVYDIDGLRDSVKHEVTGLVSKKNNTQTLANSIVQLITNEKKYNQIRKNAWQWSKELNFDNVYKDFASVIENL